MVPDLTNPEAEESFIGSIIIDPGWIDGALALGLRARDFYIERNGIVFSVILALHKKGESVDFQTISDKLERIGQLENIGGAGRLMELINIVPTSIGALSYAKIVRELGARRAVYSASQVIVDKVIDRSKDLHETLTGARDTINAEIQRASLGDLHLLTANYILDHEWPEIVWAIPDLLPTGLSILAGRPKLGKSYLALQIAQAVAAGGVALKRNVASGPVLYLALEDSGRRLQTRMRQQHWPPGLHADFMILGQFENQLGHLQNGGGERLANKIEEVKYRLVIIDTLSKAMAGDQSDMDEMNRAFAPLHRMSHDLNCAVMIVDHHRKPGMAADLIDDVMGSTAKAASADTVWGLYRERGKRAAKLGVTGRDIEEHTLAVEMDWGGTFCWHVEGDADELATTARFKEILEVLDLGRATNQTVALSVGQDKGNTFRRLQDLVAKGEVRRSKEGRQVYYERVVQDE